MSNFDMNEALVFSHKPPPGPFVMVNLFSMKEGSQFKDFIKEMTAASQQLYEDVQGEVLYSGEVGGEFTSGEIGWDAIILVRFPDWETLLSSLGDRSDNSKKGKKIDELNAIRRKYMRDYKWVFTTRL